MKKILYSSTAVAAVALAMVLAPEFAKGSTPLGTFNGMRSALAAAAQSGELSLTASVQAGGSVTVSGTLDGQPLPSDIPLHVKVNTQGGSYDIDVTADLSASNYASIKFGKNKNTLELVPKDKPDRRIEVELDPKTLKPTTWTALDYKDRAWKTASLCTYHPKATGKPAPQGGLAITAHIHIVVTPRQNGSVPVRKTDNR